MADQAGIGAPRDLPSIRSVEVPSEIEAIRDGWLALGPTDVHADPDFFLAETLAEIAVTTPYVAVVEHHEAITGLVAARVGRVDLPARVGYARFRRSRPQGILTVSGGVLGSIDHDAAALVVDDLLRRLESGRAQVVLLRHLAVGSALHQAATTLPRYLQRQHASHCHLHWELDLPHSLEAFLASRSRSTRRSLTRCRNRLRRDFGDGLAIRVFDDPEELDRMLADMDAIAARSWQGPLGVAFRDTPQNRRRARFGLEHGWYRAYVLYIDGRPVAFEQGYAYRGRFIIGRPGYDPAFASHEPGTFLLLSVIEDLCADPAVSVLDYGVGDADYKSRFANRSTEAEDVLLFAPSASGGLLNLMHAVTLRTAAGTERLLRRTGLYEPLKRRWRKRLRRLAAEDLARVPLSGDLGGP
jgi:hypothetical protein